MATPRASSHDPARLEQLEGRLELLDDLARRHGSVEGALQAADEARDRLDRLGRRDTELLRLREAETAAASLVRAAADTLSTARRTAGAKFARAIERQLADLGMAEARVDVRVEAREPGRQRRRRGASAGGAQPGRHVGERRRDGVGR